MKILPNMMMKFMWKFVLILQKFLPILSTSIYDFWKFSAANLHLSITIKHKVLVFQRGYISNKPQSGALCGLQHTQKCEIRSAHFAAYLLFLGKFRKITRKS